MKITSIEDSDQFEDCEHLSSATTIRLTGEPIAGWVRAGLGIFALNIAGCLVYGVLVEVVSVFNWAHGLWTRLL